MTSTPALDSRTAKQIFDWLEAQTDDAFQLLLKSFRHQKTGSPEAADLILKAMEDVTTLRLMLKLMQEEDGYHKFLEAMRRHQGSPKLISNGKNHRD